jgi:hypothetical protein
MILNDRGVTRALLVVALGAVGAAKCVASTVPSLPPGSKPFDPPPAYELWWEMTEACSGHSAAFAGVRWYVVPGASQLPYSGGDSVKGYWSERDNRIVLAEAAQLDGPLVRHEMLHALLRAREGHHPRGQFLGRCGGIVVCAEDCVRDAGPRRRPDKSTRVVPPESLEVTVRAVPDTPRSARYGGRFALIVAARVKRGASAR